MHASTLPPSSLRLLIGRQRPGWTLEQPFYTSQEIYAFELRSWLAEKWYVLAHVSEIREPGSYIVRELLDESLIIVRDMQGTLRGFYNVCAHRGSRICDKGGRGNSLTCPYHAWTYRLDGGFEDRACLARRRRCHTIRNAVGTVAGDRRHSSGQLGRGPSLARSSAKRVGARAALSRHP